MGRFGFNDGLEGDVIDARDRFRQPRGPRREDWMRAHEHQLTELYNKLQAAEQGNSAPMRIHNLIVVTGESTALLEAIENSPQLSSLQPNAEKLVYMAKAALHNHLPEGTSALRAVPPPWDQGTPLPSRDVAELISLFADKGDYALAADWGIYGIHHWAETRALRDAITGLAALAISRKERRR